MKRDSLSKVSKIIRQAIVDGREHWVSINIAQFDSLDVENDAYADLALALQGHAKKCLKCSKRIKQQDQQKAQNIYKKINKQDPSRRSAHMGLIRNLEGNDYVLGVKKLIRETKDDAYYALLGHHFREAREYKKAENAYRLALPRITKHYGIMYALAILYKEMGNHMKARRYARHAINRFKKMSQFYRKDPVTINYIKKVKELL